MSIDISNFNLNTPLPRFEYMKLNLANIPAEVLEEYNLLEKATADDFVYVKIQQGIYGISQ